MRTLLPCCFAAVLAALAALPVHAGSADKTWDTLSKRKQQQADAAIDAFLDERLLALRTQLQVTPCRLSVLETQMLETRWRQKRSTAPEPAPDDCRRFWSPLLVEDVREGQFQHRWHSGRADFRNRSAVRPDWRGNFERLQTLLEAKLQPLDKRTFYPYFPYGWYETVPGVEYLLRDGRTVLGITYASDLLSGGDVYEVEMQFSVFDVRRPPPPGIWRKSVNNYGRNGLDGDDFDTFRADVKVPAFEAVARWGNRFDIVRKVDAGLLDPALAPQVRIDPALEELGRQLARSRWDKMQFVRDGMVEQVAQQRVRARKQEAANLKGYRRFMAAKEAEWARDAAQSRPQTNAWAAGAIAGIRSATRTQMFWNARAAEAQARHFRAQRDGGGSGGGNRPAGGNGNGNGGYGKRQRDADVPRTAATGSMSRPDASSAGSASTGVATTAGVGSSSVPPNGAPLPPSSPEPTRVTVQRTAKGNSLALLKKAELGSGHEQEACDAARAQARLTHGLDREAQQSIQFGACGACKPTQWVFGAPNGSSWKMTCTVDYTVDIRESRPSGGSSSSR